MATLLNPACVSVQLGASKFQPSPGQLVTQQWEFRVIAGNYAQGPNSVWIGCSFAPGLMNHCSFSKRVMMHLSWQPARPVGSKTWTRLTYPLSTSTGKLAAAITFIVSSGQFLMQGYPVR